MVDDEREYLENWNFPGGPSFPVVKKQPANAGAAGDGALYLGWKIPWTPVFLSGKLHG